MFKIPLELVAAWKTTESDRTPNSVDIVCPYCGRQVNFDLRNWQRIDPASVSFVRSRCSGCGEIPSFFWVLARTLAEGQTLKSRELYMHPMPRFYRRALQ